MKRLVLAIGACLVLSGCTVAELTTTADGGVHMKYQNGIFQKTIGKFSLKDGNVNLEGYQSEASTLVRATAEGVASGLTKAAAP